MIFSALAIIILICVLVAGSIQFFPIPGSSTVLGTVIALLLSIATFGFALYAYLDIAKAQPWGIRFYYIFKIVSLVVSILAFIVASTKGADEIASLVFSSLISLYVIWCIWSLNEALTTGGKAAEDAGFNVEEAGESSPLLAQKGEREYV
eukprot:CAMPEP_0172204598 /NCGR_PEP_ID=MMETSP1050-20130122/32066_1 /TAXON_ID=233186 /ORGANISM="Cryptomonas curvata, Strain CCAP979/52" /LENGTH=149 /DNA_ID=CAMNT_0012883217 /DNA_START=96 /DNA_END=545 /DNA_ORIENTATION=+